MKNPPHVRDKELLLKIIDKASRIIAGRMVQQVKTTELGLSKDYNIR